MPAFLAFLGSGLVSLLVCRGVLTRWGAFRSGEVKEGKDRPGRTGRKKPLGGGVGIIAGLAVGLGIVLAFQRDDIDGATALLVILVAGGFGALGLLDDLGKTRGQGLQEREKLLGQAVLGLMIGLLLYLRFDVGTVYIPVFDVEVALGYGYVIFAALVLIGTANAVNLTDGVDGLAGSLLVLAALTYAVLTGVHSGSLSVPIGVSLAGATLGFLFYNRPPARLLMGDTGAMGAGATLAILALLTKTEWLLVLIGGMFVVDTLSVIIQTGMVRAGRRVVQVLRHRTGEVFRPFFVAPVHHHFQWMGWPDEQVLVLFLGGGLAFSVLAGLSLLSHDIWITGVVVMAAFLFWAGLTKARRVYYFLGTGDDSDRIWVYQGLPLGVLGRPLYAPARETDLTLADLTNMASESLLWRALGEFEVRLLLGKIHAERRNLDAALREWEAVPLRNLVLREQVVWELGRMYVARGDLIKAIQLWERVPKSKADAIAGLRETLGDVKLRLVSLARRSHQQALRAAQTQARRSDFAIQANDVHRRLQEAYRLNEQALDLLAIERRRLPAAFNAVQREDYEKARGTLNRMERDIKMRLARLDDALRRWGGEHPLLPGTPASLAAAPRDLVVRTREACRDLGIAPDELSQALGRKKGQEPLVYEQTIEPTPSRNRLFRLQVGWGDEPPVGVVVKQYEEERVKFSTACYRREQGILTLLGRFSAPVPKVLGGLEGVERSLLFLEDLGEDTLSDRLAQATPAERRVMMDLCLAALVDLHRRANAHLSELSREVEKVHKERLTPQYYRDTLRIAARRVLRFQGREEDALLGEFTAAAGPLIDILAQAPRTFIHNEFIPRNLLFHDDGVHAVDFEQATLGPREIDYATLLHSPEADLDPAAIDELLAAHQDPEIDGTVFAAANVFKSLFYAGSAAHFFEKFADDDAKRRCWWYLRDAAESAAESVALRSVAESLKALAEPPVGVADAGP